MDDIAEYLLVPQPGAVGAVHDPRQQAAVPPLGTPPPSASAGADTLDALRKLLHDKVVLQALLRLTGKD